MFPLPLHLYFALAALLTALLFKKQLTANALSPFVPFLLFILLTELTGRYTARVIGQPNSWLYNLSIPVEYLFYAYMFHVHYHKPVLKKISRLFLIFFPLFCVFNILFVQGFYAFNTNLLLAGSFFMLLFSVLSLLDLYWSDAEGNILTNPMLWIAAGVLLFNAGEFCYDFMATFLMGNRIDNTLSIFQSINNKLILVLYLSFIIAFVCKKISGTLKRA